MWLDSCSFLPSGPGINPPCRVIPVHGYDISILAVKGARNVKRLALDVRHEQSFWIRTIVRILLHDAACDHYMFEVVMSDFSLSHALLGMPGDKVTVFLHA